MSAFFRSFFLFFAFRARLDRGNGCRAARLEYLIVSLSSAASARECIRMRRSARITLHIFCFFFFFHSLRSRDDCSPAHKNRRPFSRINARPHSGFIFYFINDPRVVLSTTIQRFFVKSSWLVVYSHMRDDTSMYIRYQHNSRRFSVLED